MISLICYSLKEKEIIFLFLIKIKNFIKNTVHNFQTLTQ